MKELGGLSRAIKHMMEIVPASSPYLTGREDFSLTWREDI